MIDLNSEKYRNRKYSQSGEEGIVTAFISTVYPKDLINSLLVCEFGAHDGSNSNLMQMLEDGTGFGVFVECDLRRFNSFCKNYGQMPNLKIINDKVGWEEGNDLGAIFQRNGLLIGSLNILSIDVDGDDAHIFGAINGDIDLVLIEYNPTFGFDTFFCNPKGSNIGSSPLTLMQIASSKNLFLAALTETNLIFVNNKFDGHVKTYNLHEMKPHASAIRYAMGHDGTLVVVDGIGTDLTDEVLGIGWSRSFFVQPLPKVLRRFNKLGRSGLLYSVFALLITRPMALRSLWRKILKYRKIN